MWLKLAILWFTFAALASLCLQAQDAAKPDAPAKVESTYTPVHEFDPARNAAADIERAIAEAQKTGRRILIDLGGDWCPWCHSLNQLFQQYPDLLKLREENFITVAVYYSSENKNEQALSHYSKVLGIPHFFVLEKDGTLLQSQHVVELQSEGNYSPGRMKEFLIKWSPAASNLAKAGPGKAQ